jgi:hypothetical protein
MSGDDVSIGRVISRGFGVIAANPATVLGIALLLGGLPVVLFGILQQSIVAGELDTFEVIGSLAISFGSLLVNIVFQAIVQGSLVRAAVAHAQGERASFGESVGAGLAVMLPLVGLSVVNALAVGLGLVLLIVPGIMLYVIWSVAAPALVAERIGVFAALGRSRELTRGARWKVLGVIVILLIAYWIFAGIYGSILFATAGFSLNGMANMANAGLPIGWLIAEGLLSTVTMTVWSTVMASLYLELRTAKEGPEGRALADIFA